MIIPLAFSWRVKSDPRSFDVDAPLGDIIASPSPEYEVYLAVVDTDTVEGFVVKLRAVVAVEVADSYHRVGTVNRFFSDELADPTARLNEVAGLYGNREYLRALRDKLDEMDL